MTLVALAPLIAWANDANPVLARAAAGGFTRRAMSRVLPILAVAALAAFGAEDPWKKVIDLKSGSELRVYKNIARPPILATFDEANDERLVVVVKNEQVAIPKSEIERIDARPKTGSRVTKENRTTVTDPKPARSPYDQATGPATSTSSGVVFGSKPDFETVYRKTAAAPAKK